MLEEQKTKIRKGGDQERECIALFLLCNVASTTIGHENLVP